MNTKYNQHIIWMFWLLISAFCSPAIANTLASQPLSLTVAMASPTTITLGEPILLHYRIVNASDEEVDTYMGLDEQGWLSRSMTNAMGQNIPPRVEHKITSLGGCHIDGSRLQINGSATGYVVPTQWFAIPAPGTYVLHLHAHIPYGAGKAAASVSEQRYEHDLHTVLDQDFSFTLHVEPMDVHHFREASRDLRRRILKETDALTREALIKALLSEPEAQAHWTWQELAEDPRLTDIDRFEMADGLIESSSIETADTLACLIWQKGDDQPLSYYTPGNKELAQMYNQGDEPLRQHIRDIYELHNIQVADKIDIPQIID